MKSSIHLVVWSLERTFHLSEGKSVNLLKHLKEIPEDSEVFSETSVRPWMMSVQFSSVVQSCPILCNSMDCSTPGLPVHHQLRELTQTRVHSVGNAIQPSHPLSFPSPPTFNLSQHQGLFQQISSSHQVAKLLELEA